MSQSVPPQGEERHIPLNTIAEKVAAMGGSSGTPSLLDALKRYRAAAELAKSTEKPAEDVEAKALRKSRKRLRKHLAEGISPARAAVLAHARYRAKGGKSGVDVWSRKVAEGR